MLSCVALSPAYFFTSYVVLATYAAVVGLILSLDLLHITKVIVNCVLKKQLMYDHISTIKTGIKYAILLVTCGVISGITSHYHKQLSLSSTKNMFDLFGAMFLFLLLSLKVLGDLQYVYVALGLVRNPFYIKSSTSVRELKTFQRKLGYVGHVYNVLYSFSMSLFFFQFHSFFWCMF